jgi:hypothetical protein
VKDQEQDQDQEQELERRQVCFGASDFSASFALKERRLPAALPSAMVSRSTANQLPPVLDRDLWNYDVWELHSCRHL